MYISFLFISANYWKMGVHFHHLFCVAVHHWARLRPLLFGEAPELGQNVTVVCWHMRTRRRDVTDKFDEREQNANVITNECSIWRDSEKVKLLRFFNHYWQIIVFFYGKSHHDSLSCIWLLKNLRRFLWNCLAPP